MKIRKDTKKSPWIDVTVPMNTGMVHWPSNPGVSIERVQDVAKGGSSTVSLLTLGSHTGTHMDAPLHFFPGRASIDRMPLDATIGPARVIEIKDPYFITGSELQKHRIRRGERLLFKTRNSSRCWRTDRFINDFVHFSIDGAKYVAARGVRTIGIDYLSVGGHKSHSTNGKEVHHAILGAGIWVIEGLDLGKISPGKYDMICLPLRIQGGDGGPARAVLRPL